MRTIKGVVMKRIFFTLIVSVSLLFLTSSAESIDNLYLIGVVKKISHNKVTVNVKSNVCRGKKDFNISPHIKIKLEEGDFIRFQINSSTCKEKNLKILKIMKIHKPRMEK